MLSQFSLLCLYCFKLSMGVTDVYSITVSGVKDFKSQLEAEERARRNWGGRWGWILEEYKKTSDQLKQLRTRRTLETAPGSVDKRTTLPLPNSVNHEYGWLGSRAEFALDRYPSPGLARLPKEIPQTILWDILQTHLNRVHI